MYWVILLILLIFFITNVESLENTIEKVKTFITQEKVEGEIWNHRDAISKCNKTCKLSNLGKNVEFTGNWNNLAKGAVCECSYKGQYKKEYQKCPTFIWNQSDASENCKGSCNKNDESSKWTGNWKNLTANTSACEYEYYE
jgi:hypothetical protein